MKFVIIVLVVACSLNLFPIIKSKKYRVITEDRILPFDDESVSPITEYFSLEHFHLEQIDDDNVEIGGYLTSIKSWDPKLPVTLYIHTQYFDKATWNEGTYRLTLPDTCLECINPDRIWYNFTKLWDRSLCPATKGDKWEIEHSIVNIVTEVPSTLPIVPYKVFFKMTQGLIGFETHKSGFGIKIEFVTPS